MDDKELLEQLTGLIQTDQERISAYIHKSSQLNKLNRERKIEVIRLVHNVEAGTIIKDHKDFYKVVEIDPRWLSRSIESVHAHLPQLKVKKKLKGGEFSKRTIRFYDCFEVVVDAE